MTNEIEASKTESRHRWHDIGEPIQFTQKDFDVLDMTVKLIPDLRICAFVLKHARDKRVQYPINSVNDLISFLENDRIVAGNHVIDADEIMTYMPDEAFPIEHEGELLSRVYAALGHQRHDMAVLGTIQPKTIDKFLKNLSAKEHDNA